MRGITRRFNLIFVVAAIAMSLLCLAACTQDATVNAYLKSTVTVSIIDDRNVFPDRRTVTAKRGDDIEFLLSMMD